MTEEPKPRTRPPGAAYALAILTATNLLNYLERNAIFAVFEPIKRDLGLTDAELGWLGTAYVLVFSLAALPLGLLGDLRSRRAVIAGGIVAWSVGTALSGLALGFGSMFAARALVGFGGAAAAAASASLVADYFPGKARAFAMGVFMAGLAVGGVLGIMVAGQLEPFYGWRVTFLALAIPGFGLAALVLRLEDPARPRPLNMLWRELRDLGVGVGSLAKVSAPLLLSVGLGSVAAFLLDRFMGADSHTDGAAFSAIVGLGLVWNIRLWRKRSSRLEGDVPADPGDEMVDAAVADLERAFALVLRTPTLVYAFVGGALISFGMNGLVAWAPVFITRTLALSTAEATRLLGVAGLVAGTAGTLAGGWIADLIRKRIPEARVLVSAAGFVIGVPIAFWLLGTRDPAVFMPLFYAGFFFLTLYNGPLTATVFDVVPARIGTTVMGAYLLFIHVAGDSIAFPLVGSLSDRFGLARAIYLLPAAALVGGLITLLAARTVVRDIARAEQAPAGSLPAARP
ncbi:MAG: MFS transporter [Gemmatimonadales bacterium]